ncbi:hypothetical protein CFC21_111152 [Triticum aestivum]|uniref:VQ domain-containing protein n=3 Tax=Triticinae TaxID=1648030 RepID=A0A453T061_AEGTS|nr:VQ motif-containing protein 22 [Aegilops tauschii subsp. strangulata]XP_044440142.1 VQ motif-containing protein 22-like [Triticum aestivum]KAF7111108.1 hypothetical protein CFC21_111152 [Triticum aestivum]
MAMSDTGSSFANWTDDLYRYDAPCLGGAAADSTIVASATPTSPASAGSGDGSPSRAAGGALGPRVAGKPAARKRARASRRAPVTLLNTDASNFRAMVQQFTGIPSAPAGPFSGAPVINFGGASGYGFAPQQQPAAAVSFDHHLHQQRQQYTGAAFGYGNHLQHSLSGGDAFAHGLGAAEDRMLLQSMQAAQMPGARAAHNSANGYFA